MTEPRYRQLVEGLDAIIWEADPADLTCTFVNHRGLDLLGHDLAAWRRPGFLLDHVHRVDRPLLESALARALSGEPSRVRCRLRTTGGAWRTLVAAIERIDADSTCLRGVMIDVTELYLEEEALRQAEAGLLQADRLESVGRAAGVVAHDFNNVLAAILSLARLLERRSDDPAAVERFASGIGEAGERGIGIVRQLRQLGLRRRVATERIDVGHAVEQLYPLLARLAGDHVRLCLDIQRPLELVSIPPGDVDRILLNLVLNARDAMPEGGVITLEIRGVRGPGDLPEALPAGDWVVLAVSDVGRGIDATTRARMFEPFVTTKEAGTGAGLGLATVHALVTEARGHVLVSSTPGEGSVFRICLPAADSAELVAPTPPS